VPERVSKYRILGTLGAGATGVVYLARDDELQRDVALKALAARLVGEPGFLERFRAEAEIMARLNHPNCVRVFDYLEDDGTPYIVSELVDGATLRAILEVSGRLSPEQSLGVTRGALTGLAYAHLQGLVHRDIKPENLLADRDGVSKLADFGQAYFVAETSPEHHGSTGTAAYMSPEQVRGEQGDERSDVYAAGALMFEFMSGRPPFIALSRIAVMKMHLEREPPELSRVNPHISPTVGAVVRQALGKEPEDRYQSAAEFLAALEQVARQEFGGGWLKRASIVGLVTGAAAEAAGMASAAPAAATSQVGHAVASAPPPPAPDPPPPTEPPPPTAKPAPEPGPAAISPAGAAAVATPPVEEAAPPRAARRPGIGPGLVATILGLLLGAGVAVLGPAGAPAPVPNLAASPTPGEAAQASIADLSAHFDEARSTTLYQVVGGPPGATYSWGWIRKPLCGALDVDPGGLTAGYAHNGCNQVLEAEAVVGVCVATPSSSAVYQRNARFGDGALSAQDAAAAGVLGEQFSLVSSSSGTESCASTFAPALAATVTPLPATPTSSPPSPVPSPSVGARVAGTDAEQLPGLAVAAVVGAVVAGLGLLLLRRREEAL
jgi:serine/threonine-protein kinase